MKSMRKLGYCLICIMLLGGCHPTSINEIESPSPKVSEDPIITKETEELEEIEAEAEPEVLEEVTLTPQEGANILVQNLQVLGMSTDFYVEAKDDYISIIMPIGIDFSDRNEVIEKYQASTEYKNHYDGFIEATYDLMLEFKGLLDEKGYYGAITFQIQGLVYSGDLLYAQIIYDDGTTTIRNFVTDEYWEHIDYW